MIRLLKKEELNQVMKIWLDSNVQAHEFISEDYWKSQVEDVKIAISQAEVYVYEDNNTIIGFVGLVETYIAGIFVDLKHQSKGVGIQLLNYVKDIKDELVLSVYQKNIRAVEFYKRNDFYVRSDSVDSANNEKEYLMIWKKNV